MLRIWKLMLYASFFFPFSKLMFLISENLKIFFSKIILPFPLFDFYEHSCKPLILDSKKLFFKFDKNMRNQPTKTFLLPYIINEIQCTVCWKLWKVRNFSRLSKAFLILAFVTILIWCNEDLFFFDYFYLLDFSIHCIFLKDI